MKIRAKSHISKPNEDATASITNMLLHQYINLRKQQNHDTNNPFSNKKLQQMKKYDKNPIINKLNKGSGDQKIISKLINNISNQLSIQINYNKIQIVRQNYKIGHTIFTDNKIRQNHPIHSSRQRLNISRSECRPTTQNVIIQSEKYQKIRKYKSQVFQKPILMSPLSKQKKSIPRQQCAPSKIIISGLKAPTSQLTPHAYRKYQIANRKYPHSNLGTRFYRFSQNNLCRNSFKSSRLYMSNPNNSVDL